MSSEPEITELTNLLKSFISFKSVDNSPKQKQECIDWAVATFFGDDLTGLQRGDFEGSPWVYLPAKQSQLLVFAHLDVVPGSDDMFTLQVDGDIAKGRGVSDMKGHILPFLMAYKAASEAGEKPPVSILLTTDEETAGNTIPFLLSEGILQGEVAAFTPDSNDIGIVTEHKGGVWAELVCKGRGGHGAYPWDTENPFWVLSHALEKLKTAFPAGSHDDWQITVSPTVISGGSARNQVPDEVRCGLDIRFPPEACTSSQEALNKVQSVLPQNAKLVELQSAIPLYTKENEPIVTLYKHVAEEVLGTSIPYKREHGGTDARYFSASGIPAFLYGPKGGGLHSEDEWVSLRSLADHYQIYQTLFKRLQ